MLDEQHTALLLEINTLPGFTPKSLLPRPPTTPASSSPNSSTASSNARRAELNNPQSTNDTHSPKPTELVPWVFRQNEFAPRIP